jgi:hypothetical protein
VVQGEQQPQPRIHFQIGHYKKVNGTADRFPKYWLGRGKVWDRAKTTCTVPVFFCGPLCQAAIPISKLFLRDGLGR